MGTKQVQMEFQVVANDNVSANIIVTVAGTQKFSGALGQTVTSMPLQVYDDLTPFQTVQFDLDVPDQPFPTGNAQPWGQWTTPIDVEISVSGGNFTLQATEANYNLSVEPVTPPTDPVTYKLVAGTANVFAQCHFANQPVWTPTPVDTLDRINVNDNENTGPGSLLLLDGETCVYQVAMPYYNSSIN